jgi:hypothetical protein
VTTDLDDLVAVLQYHPHSRVWLIGKEFQEALPLPPLPTITEEMIYTTGAIYRGIPIETEQPRSVDLPPGVWVSFGVSDFYEASAVMEMYYGEVKNVREC